MAPRSKQQQERALDREKLKQTDTIWIGIRATESNLQRLAAYLLFAERPIVVTEDVEESKPFPFDDPAAFEATIPETSIDWEVVRRSTTTLLVKYVEKYGEEKAREVLRSFGAERLSLVPKDQLIPLNAALEAALEKKK